MPRRRGKFNNHRIGGFDSKMEFAYSAQLDMRKRAGDIKGYRYHENVPLVVGGIKVCTYEIDFVIEHHDGSDEYVEVKGYMTEVARLKIKLFKALYPNYKFTLVKKLCDTRVSTCG